MIGSNDLPTDDELHYQAALTLARIRPRLDRFWSEREVGAEVRDEFLFRLDREWPPLFGALRRLYGDRYDLHFHLEQLLLTAAAGWADRPSSLRELDRRREAEPDWFQSERMVGGALYVDLFSENLSRLREQVDYFRDLGLTYLHVMPPFAVRPGDNDGGYAISSYRQIDPRLGTIDDLRALAEALREAGISLVLDFVFNHTADDHEWARRAQAGEREYREYYLIFPDREMPDRYERTLREIFPTVRRGNFTWHDGMLRWVWTTFNSYQWDLNYGNPAVLRAMFEELCFLANTGVDILRLDAIAFVWKKLGTSCENLPETHQLIRVFNRLARLAAPGLLFKSEAIVHPDEVVKYVGPEECRLSYNPTLMALLWESLATRKVALLERTLQHRHRLPPGTAWVNYLRCHDDIGWTFDDADATSLGIDPYQHRRFLNRFYTGEFPGSFARGVPFQDNAQTGDMRISGTMASLAGLEQAVEADDAERKELAIRRMLLLHGVALAVAGIPLLYLGEEWGMLNDYDFVKDPAKAGDTRWIHRPKMRWEYLESLEDPAETGERSIRRRIFRGTQRLIALRRRLPALGGDALTPVASGNPHLLAFLRSREGHRLVVVANFSEAPRTIDGNLLRTAGLGRFFRDEITDQTIGTSDPFELDPYRLVWLTRV